MSQRTWLHQPMMKDARMLNLSLRALNLKHQAWRCLLASQALQQHRCCLAGYEALKIPAKGRSASASSPYIVGANIPVRVPPTTLSTPIPAHPDQRSSVRGSGTVAVADGGGSTVAGQAEGRSGAG
jgi:hypothetical protein